MVERVVERRPEPEPQEMIADAIHRLLDERRLRKIQGQVVLRGREAPWEQMEQGLIKWLVHPLNWPQLGVTDWFMFIHHIKRHSGRHRHQGGLGLFVLHGKGYSVVDGVRYDWEEGDLILLPMKPDGCEHQHFNVNPDTPAEWLAFIFVPFFDATGNVRDQRAYSPDYTGKTVRVAAPLGHTG